ncbi:Lon protease [Trichinella pseudospiralis]
MVDTVSSVEVPFRDVLSRFTWYNVIDASISLQSSTELAECHVKSVRKCYRFSANWDGLSKSSAAMNESGGM